MALKDEVKNYISKLAQTYGLDEKAMLKKAEEDEAAAKFIDESVMLRSDYSRGKDAQKAEFEAWKSNYYEKEVLPKWNAREGEFQKASSEARNARAEAAAYKAVYGTLEGFQPSAAAGGDGVDTKVVTPQGGWVSKTDYDKGLNEARQVGAIVAKELSYASSRHLKDFNEVLDLDAYEKFLGEKGYVQRGPEGLREGYEAFVRPKMAVKEKEATDKDVMRRVEEEVQKRLANAASPLDTSAPGFKGSPFFHPVEDGDAKLKDPSTPAWERDEILKRDFVQSLGQVSAGGLIKGA